VIIRNFAGSESGGQTTITEMKRLKIRPIQMIAAILLAATGYLVSCRTTTPAFDAKDLSYLYNPTRNPVNPQYNITNQSEDKSVLSVRFSASELFFSEANPRGVPMAEMLISAKLYNTSQGRVLVDTTFYSISIQKTEGQTGYIYNIPLNAKKGFDYIVEVKVLDKLRSLVMQAFIPFNTVSELNRYNFMAVDYFHGHELFDPYVRKDEFFNLKYFGKKPDSIYISYYKPYIQVPDPPSMLVPEKTIDYGPDTTIALQYSDTLPIMFPKPGIFICSVGRKTSDGFTFMNFGPVYPAMNSPREMIEPLAYLATADKMEEMRSAPRPKVALDDFWISCAKNVDKARELIRIYYTRVEYADYYFSSYKEGWRTERGMIYIMYGPPDKLYKNSEGESWGYRKPIIKSSWGTRYTVKEDYLYFNFRKKNSIFSDNDYYLQRSENPVTFWDQAVNSWKKGIVFRLDNPEEI
jgi:GWxTD domain-containing protein